MAYVRYQGQNNVYDTSSGKIVTYEQAQSQNLFAPGKIQDVNTPNPYAAPIQASSFTGQKLTPYEQSQIGGQSNGTMTTTNLQNTPEFNLAPLPHETQASQIIKQTQGLYDQLVGKSAYQQTQDTKFGIPGLSSTINDLSSQLQGIANEAAAIPVNEQSRAAGGTVLTSGLQADQNQQLRDNAVKALGVSTLLAAAQGNLATAQGLADRAVAAKYNPILEQIEVNKANLDLILNDPLSTLAEKNRAQAQKETQDKKAQETEDARTEAEQIFKIAMSAAENGASASTLKAIQDSRTQEEALEKAVASGLVVAPKKTTSSGSGSGSASTTPKLDFKTAAKNLQNQQIPSAVLATNGTLVLAKQRELLDAGLSPDAIDWLWGEVAGGTSFADIRAEMQANGVDTAVLDTFVETLQA